MKLMKGDQIGAKKDDLHDRICKCRRLGVVQPSFQISRMVPQIMATIAIGKERRYFSKGVSGGVVTIPSITTTKMAV